VKIGKETKEFVYEMTFPDKTDDAKEFVEQLWARRKVGYLLDQIRANGEKKELKDEVIVLAKKYGITTPYTSYLIVPDGPLPVAGAMPGHAPAFHLGAGGGGFMGGSGGGVPAGLAPPSAPGEVRVSAPASHRVVVVSRPLPPRAATDIRS